MSKTAKIRNVKAFVRSYLNGKNGQKHIEAGKLAVRFQDAMN